MAKKKKPTHTHMKIYYTLLATRKANENDKKIALHTYRTGQNKN